MPDIVNRFYPTLSELISVDDLPEFMSFAEDGLNDLLKNVFYKNFQYSKNSRGDTASYSIEIISNNIGIDLPFGMRLVLNPDDAGNSNISSFPVVLQYQWGVLAFLKSFHLTQFSFAPDAFFNLGLKIFRISEAQIVANALKFFISLSDTGISKFQQLVDDINLLFPDANLSLPTGIEPTVASLITLIKSNAIITKDIPELIFAIYLADSDLGTVKQKIQKFYKIIVPDGLENYISKLIKPQVKTTLQLSVGLEFPTSVLQPVTTDGTAIPNEKSIFKFAEATFSFDTEGGIGSQFELGGSLIPQYAEIGKTGIVVSFTNAKLDLSDTTNIPEATAAGYPANFVGLYIQHTSVSFNKFGADNPNKVSATISADNLFVGTGGVYIVTRLSKAFWANFAPGSGC